ncbi:helix-turn-helix transcriptional regulator [Deinococcus hohokamensis]|uniref:Helix-turn-helix transcriptional regulator n=1 Tax=Deinococcus hohokamensis TaxID=309883 RepID=A0ABV9I7M2_9DEIO
MTLPASSDRPALPDDERILVLLGLLSVQGRHGYQLSEMIEHQLQYVIQLKKGTAYLLLDRLEQHGLISSRTEQPGLRPTRKVYSLTSAGHEHFEALLTRHLEEEPSILLPGNVPLMFSEHLPAAERLALLRGRLAKLEARAAQYGVLAGACTPGVGLVIRRIHALTVADRDWLAGVVAELERAG